MPKSRKSKSMILEDVPTEDVPTEAVARALAAVEEAAQGSDEEAFKVAIEEFDVAKKAAGKVLMEEVMEYVNFTPSQVTDMILFLKKANKIVEDLVKIKSSKAEASTAASALATTSGGKKRKSKKRKSKKRKSKKRKSKKSNFHNKEKF